MPRLNVPEVVWNRWQMQLEKLEELGQDIIEREDCWMETLDAINQQEAIYKTIALDVVRLLRNRQPLEVVFVQQERVY